MASSSEKRCLDEVLGLNRDCTADEIRSAYRRLALQRHPDKLVRSGVPEADDTNAFQELVNAYEVLFDTRERAWGYYKVYRDLFEKIYANELNFAKKLGLPLPKEASVMGNLESPYVQSRRLMDEENNKLRSGSLKPDLCCCAMVGEAAEEIKEDDGVSLDDSAAASSRNEQFHERKERDYTGTPYVPVFVMLPLGFINMECELIDADNLINQMRILKSINVDGVMVDCWWGIVEAHTPQQYNWSGYRKLFEIVRDLNLKLQVVMSFHEYGGNVGDDVHIRLPKWAMEIGSKNPDIFFTDKEGRRNRECLTWGIDKQRVLKGRNALEVYFDYMRSFRVEFNEFFEDGLISEIEIGLGACGDLRYPSYPANFGWEYPGIGEFQCYDKYLMESLEKAAEARGHSIWGRAPDNAGSYNSKPQDTRFFCDGGDYDGHYGRFFLKWYSSVLVDHADRVLAMANIAFEETPIAVKLSGIHWWYKTASHAAELSAGFYNPANRDGYATIASILKKHEATLNFTCVELRTMDQHEDFPEALADPEGLVWQVLNAAWDVGIPVASENALPCYDKEGYDKILDIAKPISDPDGRHLSAFTYLRLTPQLMEEQNLMEFDRFVKRLHGEFVENLQPRHEEETEEKIL